MKKALVLTFGLASYGLFFGVFLYMIGFLGNLFVPRSVDVGPEAPFGYALLINAGLILLFGLQHSIMARPAFKRAWTKIIPEAIEPCGTGPSCSSSDMEILGGVPLPLLSLLAFSAIFILTYLANKRSSA